MLSEKHTILKSRYCRTEKVPNFKCLGVENNVINKLITNAISHLYHFSSRNFYGQKLSYTKFWEDLLLLYTYAVRQRRGVGVNNEYNILYFLII